jgi:DNA-binding NtrC family response regulator
MFQFKRTPRLPSDEKQSEGGLIVITTDPVFGSSLSEIASSCGWKCRQAPTVENAMPLLLAESIPLVIVDGRYGDDDWQQAFSRLHQLAPERCLLLASSAADPYLWQEVIRLGGFDLLNRSASRDETVRRLMFAWFCTESARKQGR